MSQPAEQAGQKQQGMAIVQTAIDMLSQALPMLGLMTEEGEAVMGALKSLGKKVGSKAQGATSLQPAQIEMMKNAAGGGPDVAQLMAMQGGGPRPGGPGGPFMQ